MYRFWDMVIAPMFDAARPRTVVEVGSDHGFNTANLARWCVDHAAVLHVVDPLPKYDIDDWQERYGDAIVFHRSLSLNALGRIGPADAVLIDGDHNYYTVSRELELVDRQARRAGTAFPVVLLHDVLWPYGRRDLYYDPDTVPDAHRQPYARKGMRPDSPDLLDEGGLNQHLCNAIYENDLRNGVLTAVEDFLAASDTALEFEIVPAVHGLGVLMSRQRIEQVPALTDLLGEIRVGGPVRAVMEMLERQRLEAEIGHEEAKIAGRQQAEAHKTQVDKLRGEVDRVTNQLQSEIERREFTQAQLARHTAERDEAVKARLEAEQRVARDQAELKDVQRRLSAQERTAAARGSELSKATEELQASKRKLEEAERKRGELDAAYNRLRRRRSVRLALGAARPFRPLFRLARRARKRSRPPGSTSSPHGNRDSEEVAEADAPELWNRQRLRQDLETVERLADVGAVTVIVPIHNAADEVRRCLEALVRNTTWPSRLLLIDDASTEPAIGGLLEEAARFDSVTVLQNDTNLGFVRTVNRGFEACDTDVVVLNSDTEVTPRWLENLVFAAYRRDDIGTVTPLSNNAGAFSVPDIGIDNPYPEHLPFDDVGRAVTQASQRRYPEAPTGSGFCLFVKRRLLDQVGGFDAGAFPRGYGEENDLCMRAAESGWKHVIDDATFVFHARSASFKTERDELVRGGRAKVDERHPGYTAQVRSFVRSPQLGAVQETVRAAYAAAVDERPRTRVLFVIHAGHGGTPQTNLDLMQRLEEYYDSFLLTSDTRHLRLQRVVDGDLRLVDEAVLSSSIVFGETTRQDYRRIVSAILLRFGIELVHVRHLFKHTLDLPSVAAALGIPVVLSLHDYFFSCPTIHLLDNNDRFCGGVCTPGAGSCRVPTRWVREGAPPLKHEWVHVWRERVGEILPYCDALVTTSPTAREVYLQSYPQLEGKRFEVIEHGRDLTQATSLAKPPVPGGRVRILIPGNLDVHKGARFIAELRAVDEQRKGRLEFHILGDAAPDFRDLGVWHGRYQRDEFNDRVKAIEPAFIGLFSIWAETYSHTLSEAWAAGVPVLASKLGALGERVRTKGGGRAVDVTDPVATYEAILTLADDPQEYERLRSEATTDGIRSVADMAADYHHLYREVRLGRRAISAGQPSSKYGRSVPRMGLLVVGSRGAHPGSVYVRTMRRLGHPTIAERVEATIIDVEAFLRCALQLDVLYVQRTAVPPELADEVVAGCEERNVPLVVDLDDNLIDLRHLPDGEDQWERFVPSLRTLLEAASLVTVSTAPLAEAVSPYATRVAVVANQLDERLWFEPLEAESDEATKGHDESPFRLLYMGTKTHARDLALLHEVLPLVRDRLEQDVRLDVIGGEPEGPGQEWYDRIRVPARCVAYPAFVRWLRSSRNRWGAGVVPLQDTPFNAYKSDLKYLEYAALGLPAVYSRFGPYAATVEPGVTGELADADPESWAAAIVSLADPSRRAEMARRARLQVLRERTLRVHAERYLDVIFSVLAGSVAAVRT